MEATFKSRKQEIADKFRKEFFNENFNYDPAFHSIVHSLMQGGDPYSIIEQLIEERKRMNQKEMDLILYGNYYEDSDGKRIDPTTIRLRIDNETNKVTYFKVIDSKIENEVDVKIVAQQKIKR